MDASIIIRTYNEARWLPMVLEAIATQVAPGLEVEILVVDSGSTDDTVKIANHFGCRLLHIDKHEFTFGRSLNMGCDAAAGRFLVFLSGHCIPVSSSWLARLVFPLSEGVCAYSYGRQQGTPEVTKFSEEMLFRKYFPAINRIPQEGFFCNNANAALLRDVWAETGFDEEVTGLEDLLFAKRITQGGHKVGYVGEASVTHIHDETWSRVKTRYEREAIALQQIMPEVHVGFIDFLRYMAAGTLLDWREALREKRFGALCLQIPLFRFHQYWGTYKGNNEHRKLSRDRKERYFYPR